MNIILLTHQRELARETNTGSLVADAMGDACKVIVWDRVSPSPELVHGIETGRMALLYPAADSRPVRETDTVDTYIIIDGTWQEARKIYNRTPYLRSVATVRLEGERPSLYTLRRNQRENGLCTAECAIEILRRKRCPETARDIEETLISFVARQRQQR